MSKTILIENSSYRIKFLITDNLISQGLSSSNLITFNYWCFWFKIQKISWTGKVWSSLEKILKNNHVVQRTGSALVHWSKICQIKKEKLHLILWTAKCLYFFRFIYIYMIIRNKSYIHSWSKTFKIHFYIKAKALLIFQIMPHNV